MKSTTDLQLDATVGSQRKIATKEKTNEWRKAMPEKGDFKQKMKGCRVFACSADTLQQLAIDGFVQNFTRRIQLPTAHCLFGRNEALGKRVELWANVDTHEKDLMNLGKHGWQRRRKDGGIEFHGTGPDLYGAVGEGGKRKERKPAGR